MKLKLLQKLLNLFFFFLILYVLLIFLDFQSILIPLLLDKDLPNIDFRINIYLWTCIIAGSVIFMWAFYNYLLNYIIINYIKELKHIFKRFNKFRRNYE